jgi:hypothetical protein
MPFQSAVMTVMYTLSGGALGFFLIAALHTLRGHSSKDRSAARVLHMDYPLGGARSQPGRRKW